MRILMIDNEFPPLGGGTGVVNYHLLTELARKPDVWVDLITSSRSRDRVEETNFSDRICIYKVPVDNLNIHHSSNRELLAFAWQALWLGRALIRHNRYDVALAFAGVPAGAVCYVLNRFAGLPYIVSLQGPDVPGFEARYNYLYPFLKPVLRIIWGNAAVVTAISRKHLELALQTLSSREIVVIANGVDCNLFYPSVFRDKALNVLCVGRLIERKGQSHLLRAFARLQARIESKPLQLTLAGAGDSEARLKHLAAELGIADKVRFLGFVPREQMPEVYRQADIFVLPSESEGMSIALLEAMASGLPVIVTDTGGTDELINSTENGLIVTWGDVEALATALAQMVSDAEMRGRMSIANRGLALTLSWEEYARKHLELFAQVGAQMSVYHCSRFLYPKAGQGT